jgi:hypothetical protein
MPLDRRRPRAQIRGNAGRNGHTMKQRPPERAADRPTEDDIAQASLGGTRGSKDLKPAKMTRRQQKDMPPKAGYDPGHTA